MSLSLVLPCYNVMKYLPKCLDSIFKNDCSDIEIVLVNDGSSDDIGGGLSQYFNKNNCDHNIEFEYKGAWIKIIHTRNCGVSAARNTGIENAMLEEPVGVPAVCEYPFISFYPAFPGFYAMPNNFRIQ